MPHGASLPLDGKQIVPLIVPPEAVFDSENKKWLSISA
jgi:hypothetical protein